MPLLIFCLCLAFIYPTYIYAEPIELKPSEKIEKKEIEKEKPTKENSKKESKDVSIDVSEKIRMQAVLETAREFGFQKGFSDRYKEIQKECEAKTGEFDQTYPFSQVLLQNGTVRPPVIARADDSTTVTDAVKMVKTGQAYRILRSAEFVTTSPSWRTYILLQDEALTPQKPPKQLEPKTSKEKKLWQKEYDRSYKEGVENAEQYFEEEINRLNREFLGMVQYHILNRQGKISLPGISKGHFAVRISEDTMELDQRTFIISDKPHFQDATKWRTLGSPKIPQ